MVYLLTSFQPACRDLEKSMSRLDIALERIIADHGKDVQSDFSLLDGISQVIENNLAMISTISRSSRSYSIGLRNSDLEVSRFWYIRLYFFFAEYV